MPQEVTRVTTFGWTGAKDQSKKGSKLGKMDISLLHNLIMCLESQTNSHQTPTWATDFMQTQDPELQLMQPMKGVSQWLPLARKHTISLMATVSCATLTPKDTYEVLPVPPSLGSNTHTCCSLCADTLSSVVHKADAFSSFSLSLNIPCPLRLHCSPNIKQVSPPARSPIWTSVLYLSPNVPFMALKMVIVLYFVVCLLFEVSLPHEGTNLICLVFTILPVQAEHSIYALDNGQTDKWADKGRKGSNGEAGV